MIHAVIIYRPPYSEQHRVTVKTFLSEFEALMEDIIISNGYLLILGDFNLHVDDIQCLEAQQFLDLITSLGLVQHVTGSTHKKGHTLDLVLSRASEPWLGNFVKDNTMPSDHSVIHSTSIIQRPPPLRVTREHRVLKDIDSAALKVFVASSLSGSESIVDVNQLVLTYNTELTRVMNSRAPLKKKTVVDKPRAEWFTPDFLSDRKALRHLESQWLASKLEIHRQMFTKARTQYNRKLEDAKAEFHRNKIEAADSKELFKIVDRISTLRNLHR